MLNGKKVLAIIPARAGSKRLVDKNIKLLAGKPLIAWTIEAALESEYIDKVVVSTDSIQILDTAKRFGAETPFLRPKELALDESATVDVINHCIDFYGKETYDLIILLQPTSPLRSQQDIDSAFEYYGNKKAESLVSVCPLEHPTHWCNTLPESGSLSKFLNDHVKGKRSQDFEKEYRLNGSIYIADIDYFRKNDGFWGKQNIYAFIMQESKSLDIDTMFDFELCEYFILKNKSNTYDK